ncbi:deaminase/reductase [Arsenicicoccus sp. oral taxon 190]|nr:deaminase/reductase [Arsenicicoccus sp. oral taxon 190]
MRDLVYYVAVSMDGFIADDAGGVSAFPQAPETVAALFERYPETCPAPLRESLGVTATPRRFDTVVMGRRTFEPALAAGWCDGAYTHLRQVVVTHDDLPECSGLTVLTGDIASQVETMKRETGKDIWLCGGGTLAAQLVEVIDEIQIKVNPVMLGSGTPLLPAPGGPKACRLVAVEALPSGVVLLTYRCR